MFQNKFKRKKPGRARASRGCDFIKRGGIHKLGLHTGLAGARSVSVPISSLLKLRSPATPDDLTVVPPRPPEILASGPFHEVSFFPAYSPSTTFYPKPNLAKNRELLKSKTKQKLNQFLFILRVWLRPVSQEEPPWTPAAGLLALQVALCCLLPPTVSQASRRQRLCFSLFYLEACGPRI